MTVLPRQKGYREYWNKKEKEEWRKNTEN